MSGFASLTTFDPEFVLPLELVWVADFFSDFLEALPCDPLSPDCAASADPETTNEAAHTVVKFEMKVRILFLMGNPAIEMSSAQ